MGLKIKKIGIGPLLLIIAAVLSVAASVVLTYSYHTNPDVATSKRARQLSELAQKHLSLPDNEVPALVEVTDASKLKNQPFFAAAQNGDVVLLFRSTRQAVIYRQAGDAIVASGELAALPTQ